MLHQEGAWTGEIPVTPPQVHPPTSGDIHLIKTCIKHNHPRENNPIQQAILSLFESTPNIGGCCGCLDELWEGYASGSSLYTSKTHSPNHKKPHILFSLPNTAVAHQHPRIPPRHHAQKPAKLNLRPKYEPDQHVREPRDDDIINPSLSITATDVKVHVTRSRIHTRRTTSLVG